jgi:hypothetical protein
MERMGACTWKEFCWHHHQEVMQGLEEGVHLEGALLASPLGGHVRDGREEGVHLEGVLLASPPGGYARGGREEVVRLEGALLASPLGGHVRDEREEDVHLEGVLLASPPGGYVRDGREEGVHLEGALLMHNERCVNMFAPMNLRSRLGLVRRASAPSASSGDGVDSSGGERVGIVNRSVGDVGYGCVEEGVDRVAYRG